VSGRGACAIETVACFTVPGFGETEDSTSMNKMTKPPELRMRLLSRYDSRFETLESAATLDKSLKAQLGGKLRKVFSPPSPDSMPDSVTRLLREIEEKIDRA
jgi:hypothetical protein